MNTISALFSKQANLTPDGIALVFENKELTYQQLEERSNQLANYLISSGVAKEDLIPICLNRSMEMIIGILGVLKAGCAYVPIDPSYPKERIKYILDDTNCRFILSNSKNSALLTEFSADAILVSIDTSWNEIAKMDISPIAFEIQPSNLAYIIYTSGSTGNPKGVMIENHSVCKY
ncbi:MAG: non-ribosomal peptide synthetase, partial [Pedobacter sp.]